MGKISVKQEPGAEVPTEVMADAIVTISDGVKRLRSGRLNEKALLLLIQHASPLTKGRPGRSPSRLSTREIKLVLDGIEGLGRAYIK